MGVEIRRATINGENHSESGNTGAPVVLGLQPFALVDHIAKVDWSLLSQIPGEPGGSFPVAVEELKHILNELNAHILPSTDNESLLKTIAGGSVANTIRGLAAGFGISSGIIGACGDDEEGKLFMSNMGFYKVDLSRLRLKNGTTAQVDELKREDFKGSKWLVLRYAILNIEVIKAAIKIAKEEGLFVSLDLASFEFARVPAIGEAKLTDATGAGDLFASGFLYGLVRGLSLEECCRVGSCSGGSVIRSLGGEVTPENWQWMYKQMQAKGLQLPELSKSAVVN